MDKRIEATTQNPERERMLFGPLVQMNLRKYIKQLKKESAWQTQDHNTITIYKSDYATMVLRGMHKKSERKQSAANGDATIQVLRGKICITTDDKKFTMRRGQMIGIEANIAHSIIAKKDSFYLLTVVSRRES
jgi:quercetin dioxygenase-like cupin family protein